MTIRGGGYGGGYGGGGYGGGGGGGGGYGGGKGGLGKPLAVDVVDQPSGIPVDVLVQFFIV